MNGSLVPMPSCTYDDAGIGGVGADGSEVERGIVALYLASGGFMLVLGTRWV